MMGFGNAARIRLISATLRAIANGRQTVTGFEFSDLAARSNELLRLTSQLEAQNTPPDEHERELLLHLEADCRSALAEIEAVLSGMRDALSILAEATAPSTLTNYDRQGRTIRLETPGQLERHS